MSHMFQDVKKVCLHLITRLYHVPVFCSQDDGSDDGAKFSSENNNDDDFGGGDDDDDFGGGGGGFGDWSPSRSPVSTLTHYIQSLVNAHCI